MPAQSDYKVKIEEHKKARKRELVGSARNPGRGISQRLVQEAITSEKFDAECEPAEMMESMQEEIFQEDTI